MPLFSLKEFACERLYLGSDITVESRFSMRIGYPNSGSVMGDYAEGWAGWRVADAEVTALVCCNSILVRRSAVKSSLPSVPRDSFGVGIWTEVERTIGRDTT